MTVKISNKIVGYSVKKDEEQKAAAVQSDAVQPVQMSEDIERPDLLLGTTYKIKPPVVDHAMYITINDVILNEDTEHEVRRPYEVFINSKEVTHFQWVIALTRVLSAVFRKGGDITFIVEELRSVYDPNGGYFKKGGVYMPSLVAEIAAVLEKHLKSLGMIQEEEMSETTRSILAEKRMQVVEAESSGSGDSDSGFPASAVVCTKCHTKAVVMMDGCQVCLSCSDSKCS